MKENLLESLSTDVVNALNQKNLVLTTAESCTGGWLGKAITDIAGSSAVFDRGFVTYSNQSKIEMLGVNAETLQQYGAVSEEITQQMANGAVNNSNASIAISTSGIAGPGGGSEEKPVGSVCFAWHFNAETISASRLFTGNRDSIRYQSCCYALEKLLEQLA